MCALPLAMRRILVVLLYLACVGHSRRVQPAVARESHAERAESQQRSRMSLARHRAFSIHYTKVIAALLFSNLSRAAFHSSNLAALHLGRTLAPGSAGRLVDSSWKRCLGCSSPQMSLNEEKQTFEGVRQVLLGRREALRITAAALVGTAATAANARDFGTVNEKGELIRPTYSQDSPEKQRVKKFNQRYKSDESVAGDTGDYSLEARTQVWQEGNMSFQVPALWIRTDNSSWYDPIGENTLMNEVKMFSRPTNLTNIKQIKLDYLDLVKDYKFPPEWKETEMLSQAKRFFGSDVYYDAIVTRAPPMRECPESEMIVCKVTDVYTISATVSDGRLWIYQANVKEDQWKRAKDPILKAMASFEVSDAPTEEKK